jgi:hypothetical protein
LFLAILWREQATFWWDDDGVCFVLDQHSLSVTFSWIFIVLVLIWHISTIPIYKCNQCLSPFKFSVWGVPKYNFAL